MVFQKIFISLTKLTGNPRHNQLLMLIAKRKYININKLANLLNVSTQTVRQNIRKLSKQGLITRHHGGAGRASSVVNTAFKQRKVSQTKKKKAIAKAVANYIPNGSTIFITIGTTVKHVARALLNHNHLQIITNSLRVAHILYHNPRFKVMVPGGTLRSHNSKIIGPSAASFVANFRANYLVTSVGAIKSNGALIKFNVNKANVVKTIMAHAKNILLVANHTKYHASAAVKIGNVAQVTALFTNKLPPAALKSRLQNNQIKIILPQKNA